MFRSENHSCQMISRRALLTNSGLSFGTLALSSLLNSEAQSASESSHTLHHLATAKRVIFLFMHGGPSQIDTFDYKPELTKQHGKPLPFDRPRVVFKQTGNVMKSPWKFKQYGESGLHISELFPQIAKHVDDLCMIHSMHGMNPEHGAAVLKFHTGSDTFIRPSMGAWINYGLGSESKDLPAFLSICPTLSHGGPLNWGAAFLPAEYQGTALGNASISPQAARIGYIKSNDSQQEQERYLSLLETLNSTHQQRHQENRELEARIQSFELAFRMQSAVPKLQDLSNESKATKTLYGLNEKQTRDFGYQCLMARRFSESGVRFIQCNHCLGSGSGFKWDQHGNLKQKHAENALEVDQPIAGLLTDLKQRGLLEDTLVIWGGEFGRTPTVEGKNGRDHNPEGFTIWMAGGGVKGGFRFGETDEFGYYAVKDRVHLHDFHATILHLLGLDHERLTYRHAGRDFRLTDVHGRVITEILKHKA